MENFITLAEERFARKDWRFTAGVRNTIKVILEAKVPLAMTDIAEKLKEKEREIDITTIYRIVDRLVALDLVHLLNGQVLACTDPNNKEEEHHFLVCESCGEAEEIFLNYKESISRQLNEEKKFKLRKVDLVFYGLCRDCRRKFD